MTPLTPAEAKTLAVLLMRACANGQLNLQVRSPLTGAPDEADPICHTGDRHDGNAVTGHPGWLVGLADSSHEDPDTGEEIRQHEVTVLVDNGSLRFLAGLDAEDEPVNPRHN